MPAAPIGTTSELDRRPVANAATDGEWVEKAELSMATRSAQLFFHNPYTGCGRMNKIPLHLQSKYGKGKQANEMKRNRLTIWKAYIIAHLGSTCVYLFYFVNYPLRLISVDFTVKSTTAAAAAVAQLQKGRLRCPVLLFRPSGLQSIDVVAPAVFLLFLIFMTADAVAAAAGDGTVTQSTRGNTQQKKLTPQCYRCRRQQHNRHSSATASLPAYLPAC